MNENKLQHISGKKTSIETFLAFVDIQDHIQFVTYNLNMLHMNSEEDKVWINSSHVTWPLNMWHTANEVSYILFWTIKFIYFVILLLW